MRARRAALDLRRLPRRCPLRRALPRAPACRPVRRQASLVPRELTAYLPVRCASPPTGPGVRRPSSPGWRGGRALRRHGWNRREPRPTGPRPRRRRRRPSPCLARSSAGSSGDPNPARDGDGRRRRRHPGPVGPLPRRQRPRRRSSAAVMAVRRPRRQRCAAPAVDDVAAGRRSAPSPRCTPACGSATAPGGSVGPPHRVGATGCAVMLEVDAALGRAAVRAAAPADHRPRRRRRAARPARGCRPSGSSPTTSAWPVAPSPAPTASSRPTAWSAPTAGTAPSSSSPPSAETPPSPALLGRARRFADKPPPSARARRRRRRGTGRLRQPGGPDVSRAAYVPPGHPVRRFVVGWSIGAASLLAVGGRWASACRRTVASRSRRLDPTNGVGHAVVEVHNAGSRRRS